MDGVSFEKLVKKAREFAEEKNPHKFAKNIAIAETLATTDDEKRQLYKTEIIGLRRVNNHETALEVTEKAEELFDDVKFKYDVLRNRGIALGKIGEDAKAVDIFKEILGSDIQEQILKAHINLVWIFLRLYVRDGEQIYIKKAEEHCNSILDILESHEPDDRVYKVFLTNLGTLYYNQGDYDKALEVFEEQKEKFNNDKDLPIIYNNLASILIEKYEIKSAEEYLHKALFLAEQTHNYQQIGENYMLRAQIAMTKEDYIQVKDNYVVAYDNFCEANDLAKACLVYKDIQNIDFKVNNESLDKLTRKLPSS